MRCRGAENSLVRSDIVIPPPLSDEQTSSHLNNRSHSLVAKMIRPLLTYVSSTHLSFHPPLDPLTYHTMHIHRSFIQLTPTYCARGIFHARRFPSGALYSTGIPGNRPGSQTRWNDLLPICSDLHVAPDPWTRRPSNRSTSAARSRHRGNVQTTTKIHHFTSTFRTRRLSSGVRHPASVL